MERVTHHCGLLCILRKAESDDLLQITVKDTLKDPTSQVQEQSIVRTRICMLKRC